ncbi:GRIP and coiled-coil domain-containing protein 2 [Chytriomyces hyalinus]|nr:GRIP and coiled-coil domain-containing protein 2 [Chytriomyces hyalinus]
MAHNIVNQATAAQTALAGRLSPNLNGTSASGTAGPAPPVADPDPADPALFANDADRVAALAVALENMRHAHSAALVENNTLKSQNTALESQLKDLRLKAKLKITQLQRELDSTKAAASTSAAAEVAATSRKSYENGENSKLPADARNPADVEMIEALQSKVVSLSNEVLSAKAGQIETINSLRDQIEHLSTDLLSLQSQKSSVRNSVYASVATSVEALDVVSETPSTSAQTEAQNELMKKVDDLQSLLEKKHEELASTAESQKYLSSRIENLESTVSSQSAELQSFQSRNDSWIAEKESLVVERDSLKQIQIKVESENSRLARDLALSQSSLKERLSESEKLESKLTASLQTLSSESAALKLAIAALETDKAALESRLSNAETSFANKLSSARAEIANLETELSSTRANMSSLQNDLDLQTLSHQRALSAAATANIESMSETSDLSSQTAKEPVSTKDAENTSLEILESVLAEKRLLTTKLDESVRACAQATRECRDAVMAHEETASQMSQISQDRDAIDAQLQESRARVSAIQTQLEDAEERLKQALDSSCKDIESAEHASEARIETYKNLSEAKDLEIKELMDRVNIADRDIEQLTQAHSAAMEDVVRLKKQIIQAEEDARSVAIVLETADANVRQLESELETKGKTEIAQAEVSKVLKELEITKVELDQVTAAKRKALDEKLSLVNQIQAAETKISELERKNASLLNAKTDSNQNVAALQSGYESLSSQLANAKSELEVLKEVLAKKDQDLVALQMASKVSSETDVGKAFLMDEQIMDLKLQIANRQKEVATLQEALQRSQASTAESQALSKDSDDKIRKLKGLLGQASKTLQESKKASAAKDAEIENLKTDVEHLDKLSVQLQEQDRENKSTIERLMGEIQDEKEIAFMKSGEIEQKTSDLEHELSRVKAEFQSYKVRAHTALQQSASSAFEVKVVELEEINAKLMREKMDSRQEIASLNERIQHMSSELNTALDQLVAFETQLKRYEGSSRELALLRHEVDACNRRIETEQELHSEALRNKDAYYRNSLELIKQENIRDLSHLQDLLATKDAEIKSHQGAMESLRNEVSLARQEASKATVEANRVKAAAAAVSANHSFNGGPNASLPSSAMSPTLGIGGGFFSSMTSPVAPSGSGYSPASSRRESVAQTHHGARESFADLMMGGSARRGSIESAFGAGTTGGFGNAIKERELLMNLEKVSELLVEAEEQIKRLLDQEKVLKEEIRKFERSEKRNELLVKQQNVEYLKNIVLSFLETDSKEQLLPVVAKVLELSPDEVRRVRSSIVGLEEEQVRRSVPNFGFF